MIINAVADKYNLLAGKIANEGMTTSYGTDVVLYDDNHIEINFDIISQDDTSDYFILSKIKLIGNDKVLEQYQLYQKDGEAVDFIREIFDVCGQLPEIKGERLVIGGLKIARKTVSFDNKENDLQFRLEITCKKVGIDNGKYLLFNVGMLFQLYSEATN